VICFCSAKRRWRGFLLIFRCRMACRGLMTGAWSSGIIYVIKHGLQWKDAPKDYGPPKTFYNRFIRWSRLGVFDRIFAALAGEGPKPERIMIDSTHLKAHRTAASLLKKGVLSRCIGRTKGGLNSKLHVVCDGAGKPLVMLLTEGQMSDHKDARLMLEALLPASAMIADRGYDNDWFRAALKERGTQPCIPPTRGRRAPSTMTRPSTANATRSKTSSPNSRTGGVSPPATTDAPTPSSQRSASQPPSPSISINES